jgi:hypothetical protein
MKKANVMMLALMAMTAGVCASQDAVAAADKKQEVTAKACSEQDFVSKLNEQNKKAFNGMNADQKKAAMSMASCDGSCPSSKKTVSANEAVEKVLGASAAQATAAKAEKAAEKPVTAAPAAQKPANAPQAK